MIKIYFAAMVGTLFLTVVGGVALEATVWSVLELVHVPQTAETIIGLAVLLPIAGFFLWFFPRVVKVEKMLAKEGY